MESEEESGGGGLDKRKVLRQRSVDKGKQEKLQKKTLVNNLTKLSQRHGNDQEVNENYKIPDCSV